DSPPQLIGVLSESSRNSLSVTTETHIPNLLGLNYSVFKGHALVLAELGCHGVHGIAYERDTALVDEAKQDVTGKPEQYQSP
ncbi:hypothetical protein TorRG33x02_157460, partial [Trema orientale]